MGLINPYGYTIEDVTPTWTDVGNVFETAVDSVARTQGQQKDYPAAGKINTMAYVLEEVRQKFAGGNLTLVGANAAVNQGDNTDTITNTVKVGATGTYFQKVDNAISGYDLGFEFSAQYDYFGLRVDDALRVLVTPTEFRANTDSAITNGTVGVRWSDVQTDDLSVGGNTTWDGDSPQITVGSGNGGPDVNNLADAASDFRTHWHKDAISAAAGSFRELYDTNQRMLMQYYDGAGYRNVTRIVNDTQYFIQEGAQGSSLTTFGNPSFTTTQSASLRLLSGPTGLPGVEFDDGGNIFGWNEVGQVFFMTAGGTENFRFDSAAIQPLNVQKNLGSTIFGRQFKALYLVDGIAAPGTPTGGAVTYIDSGDGDYKIKFSDGHVAVIAADS